MQTVVSLRHSQAVAIPFIRPLLHNNKASNAMMCNLPEGYCCEILSSDGLAVRERSTRIGNIEDLDDLKGVRGFGETGLVPYLPNNKEFVRFVHHFELIYRLL